MCFRNLRCFFFSLSSSSLIAARLSSWGVRFLGGSGVVVGLLLHLYMEPMKRFWLLLCRLRASVEEPGEEEELKRNLLFTK